jgi:hypothetical protein
MLMQTTMINTNLTATALQGLEQSGQQLNAAARQIAVIGSGSADVIDLSAKAVALTEAKIGFEADVNVMKAAQEMDKHLLHLLA